MKLFEEYRIKDMALKNRIVMPPMCMYQATADGFPTLFHLAHYAARAVGGAGLIIVESTGVTPEGRITDRDLGLWDDSQVSGLKRIAEVCHQNGAKIALQLNHAGRKSTSLSGLPLAPSVIPYSGDYRTPRAITKDQIHALVDAFRDAAARADKAGFDALEIHAAHGYLVHEFLSPLTNHRKDEYGGNLEGRARFLREILEAVRGVWPAEKPLWLRVSASDYSVGGIDAELTVKYVELLKPLADLVHVSSGGLLPIPVKDYPGYQIALSEKIRSECKKPTITVGLITNEEMAEEILQNGRADLVALGRELLRDPYFPLHAAERHGVPGYVPESYKRAFRRA